MPDTTKTTEGKTAPAAEAHDATGLQLSVHRPHGRMWAGLYGSLVVRMLEEAIAEGGPVPATVYADEIGDPDVVTRYTGTVHRIHHGRIEFADGTRVPVARTVSVFL